MDEKKIAVGQPVLTVCLTENKKFINLTCFNKSATKLESLPPDVLKVTVLGNSKVKFISLQELKETSSLG